MLIRYWWPAMLWSLIILVLTLIPGKAIPEVDFFQIDKLVHFFVFGVLMILSLHSAKRSRDVKGLPANPYLLSSIYSICFGVIIEVIQEFIPGRNFSVADILANSIGVGLGYWVFRILQKRKII